MPYHENVTTTIKGATAGVGATGAADVATGNGFDRIGNAVAQAAQTGGDVIGAVQDLVLSRTPDFVNDILSRAFGNAPDAAGMLIDLGGGLL